MKFYIYIAIGLVLLVFSALCIGQENNGEVKQLTFPGHGNQVYSFQHDVKKASKVPSSNEEDIMRLIWGSNRLNIVFNGSSTTDNGYFQVALINIITKLQPYFSYEGKMMTADDFPKYYYDQTGWHNQTGDNIEKPHVSGATLWLLGPNTGANETSVRQDGKIIFLQGTSYDNLTLAGDKFVLIVFGIK